MIQPAATPTKLLILGNHIFAEEVADLVSDIPDLELCGFVANMQPYEPGATLLGYPIFWIDELPRFDDSYRAVCAIGSHKRRFFVQQAQELGMRFATVIHPTARISRTAVIGEGTIISAGALIAGYTEIGRHVIINRGAMIGHHTKIGDLANIAPGANLAGLVTVGKYTWVGLGAIVLERLNIGEQSIVGAGALVTHDVPDRVKVVGAPARIVERDSEGL
ncbi:MAG: acetyltransferase [Chloroflexi bacterium]|nr:acetyltransferase [Chloroflexota bacterium]